LCILHDHWRLNALALSFDRLRRLFSHLNVLVIVEAEQLVDLGGLAIGHLRLLTTFLFALEADITHIFGSYLDAMSCSKGARVSQISIGSWLLLRLRVT
jgi:hypothetical protein